MEKLFCDVKAGENICKICTNKAYYPVNNPAKKYVDGVPVMQLFRCGHGMCYDCYKKMQKSQMSFSCPFCRNKGTVIMESFGSSVVKNRIYTIRDFLCEWKDRLYLLKFTSHPYVLLHKQICKEEAPPGKPKRYPKKKKKKKKINRI